jgi:hypothetical protein
MDLQLSEKQQLTVASALAIVSPLVIVAAMGRSSG